MDLIYARTACDTPKRKENFKSHHMAPLKYLFLCSENTIMKITFLNML